MGNVTAPATGGKRRIIGFDFIKTVAILLVITIHMIGGSTLSRRVRRISIFLRRFLIFQGLQ